MRIKSKHKFNCDREQVWDSLMDIDLLSSIISDRRGLKKTGKNEYKGKLPVELGPIEGKLDTTFKLSRIDKPNRFSLKVTGKYGEIRVRGKGTFKLRLESDATAVNYRGSMTIYTKVPPPINQLGFPGPLVKAAEDTVSKALDKLFRKIEKQCRKEKNYAH